MGQLLIEQPIEHPLSNSDPWVRSNLKERDAGHEQNPRSMRPSHSHRKSGVALNEPPACVHGSKTYSRGPPGERFPRHLTVVEVNGLALQYLIVFVPFACQ